MFKVFFYMNSSRSPVFLFGAKAIHKDICVCNLQFVLWKLEGRLVRKKYFWSVSNWFIRENFNDKKIKGKGACNFKDGRCTSNTDIFKDWPNAEESSSY